MSFPPECLLNGGAIPAALSVMYGMIHLFIHSYIQSFIHHFPTIVSWMMMLFPQRYPWRKACYIRSYRCLLNGGAIPAAIAVMLGVILFSGGFHFPHAGNRWRSAASRPTFGTPPTKTRNISHQPIMIRSITTHIRNATYKNKHKLIFDFGGANQTPLPATKDLFFCRFGYASNV